MIRLTTAFLALGVVTATAMTANANPNAPRCRQICFPPSTTGITKRRRHRRGMRLPSCRQTPCLDIREQSFATRDGSCCLFGPTMQRSGFQSGLYLCGFAII